MVNGQKEQGIAVFWEDYLTLIVPLHKGCLSLRIFVEKGKAPR
jgi:hypothetical protein